MAGKMLKKAKNLLFTGKLEKAKLYTVTDGLKLGKALSVQFNPSEYQISRTVRLSKKLSVGKDQDIDKMQAAAGSFATFSATLYFDTDTDLSGFDTSSLSAAVKSVALPDVSGVLPGMGRDPDEVCQEIANMLKYNDEEHAPLKVRFVWGDLDFMGYVASSTISYTMFARDGTPLRAKLQITIVGEETALLQKRMMRTFNSPNRTKERVLTEGDPLWMMAHQEYDDPAMWRTIAEANGILNPRKISRAMTLKVPSIR